MEEYKGYGGTVELHDDQIVIRREGAVAKIGGQGATREIPCSALSGVTLKPATRLVNGYLQLQLGGAPVRDHRGDPNSILFRHKDSARFEELADILQQRIADNVAQGVDPTAVDFDPGESRTDRLQSKTDRLQSKADRLQSKTNAVTASDTQYLGGWSGHTKTYTGMSKKILRVDTNGVSLVAFKTIFTIPWSVIVALEVEGPEQASQRVTVTRALAVGVFALAAKKKSKAAVLIVRTPDGEEALFQTEKYTAAELRTKLTPFISQLRVAQAQSPAPVEAAAKPSGVDSDPVEQIRKLGELRDQGLLTPEEFEAKKTELLGRL